MKQDRSFTIKAAQPVPAQKDRATRIAYIDNLRVACMVLGIFIHASTLGDFVALDALAAFSNLFRMATFIVVSGYFAVVLYERYGQADFMINRLRALLVPFAAALLLLNPLTLWLVFRHHNAAVWPDAGPSVVWAALSGEIAFEGPVIWHLHLWFLIPLSFYTLITPLILPGVRRLSSWLVGWRPGQWRDGALLPLILGVGVVALVLSGLLILKIAGPVGEGWPLRATVLYFPFFLFGMVIFLQERIWQAVHRIDIPLLLMIITVFGLRQLQIWPDQVASMLGQVQTALLRLFLTCALLALFRRWGDFSTPGTRVMSRAIYTVYLVHYLLIYLIAAVWTSWAELGEGGVLVVIALTGVSSLLLHLFVIERIPVLAWLFNGKPRADRAERKPLP